MNRICADCGRSEDEIKHPADPDCCPACDGPLVAAYPDDFWPVETEEEVEARMAEPITAPYYWQ